MWGGMPVKNDWARAMIASWSWAALTPGRSRP